MEFTHPSGRKLLEDVGRIFTDADSTIFERKDRYILFVCGGPIAAADSLRSRFLEWAKTELPDVITVLAEDAYGESYTDEAPEFINLGQFEKLIAGVSDCVLIFPESVGSFAEIGLFSNTAIKKKMLVANDDSYHNRDSFLNLGPISHINSSSLLRPAIPISRARAEDGFAAVRERLGRLRRRSNRRKFRYQVYKRLSMEDRLVAVYATIILLRAVTFAGLVQSLKITFGAVNKRELRHFLSILIAGRYVVRSGEYFASTPSVKPFLDFDGVRVDDVITRVTLYYTLHHPKTLECLRGLAK